MKWIKHDTKALYLCDHYKIHILQYSNTPNSLWAYRFDKLTLFIKKQNKKLECQFIMQLIGYYIFYVMQSIISILLNYRCIEKVNFFN